MSAIGTIIGVILTLIVLGVLFWAGQQILNLIKPYVGEPFWTLIRIALVLLLLFIVIWALVTLVGLAGIHVPWFR